MWLGTVCCSSQDALILCAIVDDIIFLREYVDGIERSVDNVDNVSNHRIVKSWQIDFKSLSFSRTDYIV